MRGLRQLIDSDTDAEALVTLESHNPAGSVKEK